MLKRASVLPIGLLLVCFLSAKDFWIERPYTEWTQKEAIKILVNSPWSSSQTVKSGSSPFLTGPSPAEPQPSCKTCPSDIETEQERRLLDALEARPSVSQRKYFIRFRTSTPVRMALARLAVLNGKTSEEKARAYIENIEFPGQIVVVVEPESGGDAPELNLATLDSLKENSYLVLKKSKRRIWLQQYVTPSQFGGTQAFFIFPREQNTEELISLSEEEVRFFCRLNNEMKIEQKFKLRKMLYKGVLDL